MKTSPHGAPQTFVLCSGGSLQRNPCAHQLSRELFHNRGLYPDPDSDEAAPATTPDHRRPVHDVRHGERARPPPTHDPASPGHRSQVQPHQVTERPSRPAPSMPTFRRHLRASKINNGNSSRHRSRMQDHNNNHHRRATQAKKVLGVVRLQRGGPGAGQAHDAPQLVHHHQHCLHVGRLGPGLPARLQDEGLVAARGLPSAEGTRTTGPSAHQRRSRRPRQDQAAQRRGARRHRGHHLKTRVLFTTFVDDTYVRGRGAIVKALRKLRFLRVTDYYCRTR